MIRRPALSLRGQAIAWLAQRDHSRQELRRKLVQRARRQASLAAAAREREAVALPADTPPSKGRDLTLQDDEPLAVDVDVAAIDALLDELQQAGHLSDARFVESRVHLRAARFGTRRIDQELRRLGAPMDDDTRAALAATEVDRARRVWAVKFGKSAVDAAERARQARFLAGRGFSGEVIRRVLSTAGDDEELASGEPDDI